MDIETRVTELEKEVAALKDEKRPTVINISTINADEFKAFLGELPGKVSGYLSKKHRRHG